MFAIVGIILIIGGYSCIQSANKLPLTPDLNKGNGSFGIGLFLLIVGIVMAGKNIFMLFV